MSGAGAADRDRDSDGRPRNARPRDRLGRPLDRDQAGQAPPDEVALAPREALRRAQQLLDSGEPFAAHEVFEAVWKAAPDAERALWRGLAQLAVGITHVLRGNEAGARALLDRAAQTLAAVAAPAPYDVDADGIRRWAAAAADDAELRHRLPRLQPG